MRNNYRKAFGDLFCINGHVFLVKIRACNLTNLEFLFVLIGNCDAFQKIFPCLFANIRLKDHILSQMRKYTNEEFSNANIVNYTYIQRNNEITDFL